jgi:hypothetical protein
LKTSTIETKINVLVTLKKRCNLWDSNQVTETIKKADWINR